VNPVLGASSTIQSSTAGRNSIQLDYLELREPTIDFQGGREVKRIHGPTRGDMTAMTRPIKHIAAVVLSVAAILPAYAVGEREFEMAIEAASDFRYSIALEHFRSAAELGNIDAQRSAGLMLLYGGALYGQEIRTNRSEAIRWLGLAAKGGCKVSAYEIARLAI
jgi:TPR repeat protein